MRELLEKIKNLPAKSKLYLNPQSVYASDEWGMNRYLTTTSDGEFDSSDLERLRVEVVSLQEENDKLRNALEQIVATYHMRHKTAPEHWLALYGIAQSALDKHENLLHQ